MKVIAIRDFIANKVVGYPGKILTEDEVSQVEDIFESMEAGKLISVSEESVVEKEEEVAAESPPADDKVKETHQQEDSQDNVEPEIDSKPVPEKEEEPAQLQKHPHHHHKKKKNK